MNKLTFLILSLLGASAHAQSNQTITLPPPGYKLAWSDEFNGAALDTNHPDVLTIAPDLENPAISVGNPAPGMMVLQSLPAYAGTEVAHALYLPTDWAPGKRFPVLIEYCGNGSRVRDGNWIGYGITGGKGFIWAVLPFVSQDHKRDLDLWWGDVAAIREKNLTTFTAAKKELGLMPLTETEGTRQFIAKHHPGGNYTIVDLPCVNHTAKFVLRDTPARQQLREWLQNVLRRAPAKDQARPNIILCMTDDQGWYETSYNGHPELKTPELDKMAAAGIRFDRFYAAFPMCSPTRASCMSGRYPARYRCMTWGHDLPLREVTIAEAVKTRA